VADNCNYAAPTPTSYITRDGSAAVALRARHEGYQWAGGCWNDNDRDDSPNDPHEDSATGGEGGDCSGFTFKVWREALDTGDAGFDQWGMLRNVHGPYTAAALPPDPADAYGAGDCFAAGLAFALAAGLEGLAALDFAARCGAGALAGPGVHAEAIPLP